MIRKKVYSNRFSIEIYSPIFFWIQKTMNSFLTTPNGDKFTMKSQKGFSDDVRVNVRVYADDLCVPHAMLCI